MKKLLAIVLAALMCVALFAGCGTKDAGSAAAGTETKAAPVVDINEGAECKMAYIPMGSGQEDYPVILNGMQEALTLYPNVSLITCDPGFNPTNQIDMMKEFINQEVDVIFINSMDGIALNSTIAEAEEAGIVVISINNGVEGNHTAHIQNTTYDAGVEAAKFMTNVAPKNAKTVILDVPAELKATCTMGQGFEDYANANPGSYEILEDYAQSITSIEVGYQAASEVLAKYDQIDVLYCVNDNTAVGAAQAVAAAGLEDAGIIIWGYSGTPAALDAIAKGQIYGTSYADPFYEGHAAMVSAMNFVQLGINGKSLGNEYYTNVFLPTHNVTADNVLDIISGTHWDMSAYNY